MQVPNVIKNLYIKITFKHINQIQQIYKMNVKIII